MFFLVKKEFVPFVNTALDLGLVFKTIVWWNFNAHNVTIPETDDMGNIFMSGYNPMLLKYLKSGFDGNKFLDKLLEEYKSKI